MYGKLKRVLRALSYPSQHPFILATEKNDLLCIRATDEYGSTPLQRAIQHKNHNMVKLFSFLPVELNDYEDAYLKMICDDDRNAMDELEIIDHLELIQCLQALYPNIDDDGKCFGIGFMTHQAFTLGQIEQFYHRLANIKYNLWPIVQKAIYQVNTINGLTLKSTELFDEVRKIVQPQFPYTIWYDLYAFFDGVLLYQTPVYFSELFPHNHFTQEDLIAEPMVRPVFYDKKILSASNYEFKQDTLGIYSRDQLTLYFEYFQLAFIPIQIPITLAITIGDHFFNIGYNKGLFTFLDANYLNAGKKSVQVNQLVDILFTCYPKFCSTKSR